MIFWMEKQGWFMMKCQVCDKITRWNIQGSLGDMLYAHCFECYDWFFFKEVADETYKETLPEMW